MHKTNLAILQERRTQALDANDWLTYYAFDLLIAHALDDEELVGHYTADNAVLNAFRNKTPLADKGL